VPGGPLLSVGGHTRCYMDRYVLLLETFGSIVGSLRCRAGFSPPTRQPSPSSCPGPTEG
jgi:hypothetical protein